MLRDNNNEKIILNVNEKSTGVFRIYWWNLL